MNNNKQLALIEKELKSNDTINRVMIEANLPDDEKSKKKVMSYALSVLTELDNMSRTLDPKKAMYSALGASPESIKASMISAVKYGLPIDSSKLAFLDCRNKEAIFMPTAKGFIYKIKEFYSDFTITATPFFEGDEITIEDDKVTYKLFNPFCDDFNKLQGFLVKYKYTENLGKKSARLVEGVEAITKGDLIKMRNMSGYKNNGKHVVGVAWQGWMLERSKTAAIKRVAKRLFTNHHALQELVAYENDANYKLDNDDVEISSQQTKIIDNIKEAITKQPEINEVVEVVEEPVEAIENTNEHKELYNKGLSIAKEGSQSVRNWALELTEMESSFIKENKWDAEFSKIAKAADKENDDVPFII